jgi:hypothetical protein
LEDTSKEKALSIFKEVQDITDMYHIVIRNTIQFGLIVDYLSVRLSFRAVAKVILMTKEWTGMASIGSVSEGKVAAIAQVVCSHSLKLILNLWMKCWTF